MRIVIVGAGPAGLAAARAYREAGGTGSVTLLGAEAHAPYRRPPLTKEYLRGELARDALPLEAPGWYAAHAVALRPGVRAERLDPDSGEVVLEGGERVPFDMCVLATGSAPLRPPLPGADDPALYTMRSVDDADRLAALAPGSAAVVIGSGFVGCEAAASLAARGVRVTQVSLEHLPQVERLGEEVGRRIAGWLEGAGVRLRLGAAVRGIAAREEGGHEVRLAGGEAHAADAVLLATGIRPRVALAEGAGLRVREGAVAVDAAMRTSAPEVLAAGDVALAHNAAAGRPLRAEHWGEALAHGAVAGRTLAGVGARWDAAPGFWSTIGRRTLKHVAWGDGWDDVRLDEHDGSFTARYTRGGRVVGVLTHGRDEDNARGRALVEGGAPA